MTREHARELYMARVRELEQGYRPPIDWIRAAVWIVVIGFGLLALAGFCGMVGMLVVAVVRHVWGG